MYTSFCVQIASRDRREWLAARPGLVEIDCTLRGGLEVVEEASARLFPFHHFVLLSTRTMGDYSIQTIKTTAFQDQKWAARCSLATPARSPTSSREAWLGDVDEQGWGGRR